MELVLLAAIVVIVSSLSAGSVAQAKGRSRTTFIAIGLALPIVTLLAAHLLPEHEIRVGSLVKVVRKTELADGRVLVLGTVYLVLALDAIDGRAALQVRSNDGTSHWLPKAGFAAA